MEESTDRLECNYCDTLTWRSRGLRLRSPNSDLYDDITVVDDDDKNHEDFRESFDEFRFRLFHGFSNGCDPCCKVEEDMCDLCRHNRIGHIVHHMSNGAEITMEMGSVSDIQARRACKVCRIVSQAVERNGTIPGNDQMLLEIGRRFYLRSPDHRLGSHETYFSISLAGRSSSEGQLATLYLQSLWYNFATMKYISEGLRGAYVDWDRVKGWLNKCDEYIERSFNGWTKRDTRCYAGSLDHPPSGFRLIDVNTLCVVQAPSTCECIALSYVWGSPDRVCDWVPAATRKNTLETIGSLSKDRVPPTIGDAIQVCYRLGIGYLWIDRYCIIQDDERMKQAQIDSMDQIYSHAILTLVAVEGEDPSYGLSGVSGPMERSSMLCLNFANLQMVEQTRSLSKVLEESKWAERGWTFQEAILSKRLLFFTNDEVVYECGHGRRKYEHNLRVLKPRGPGFLGRGGYDYFSAIPEFSERKLSSNGDALRAITGVLNSLHGEKHLFGLPLDMFDDAIQWITAHDQDSRDMRFARNQFPSWSWSSSSAKVTYRATIFTGAAHLATCATVIEGPNGDREARVIDSHRDEEFEYSWKEEAFWHETVSAWKSGFFKYAPQFAESSAIGSDPNQWGSSKELWSKMRGLIPGQGFSPVVNEFADTIETASLPGRISIFTQCAHMDLRFTEHSCGQKTLFRLMSSDKLNVVGSLSLDHMADKERLECFDDPRPLEFLGISLRHGPTFHLLNGVRGIEIGREVASCEPFSPVVTALLTARVTEPNLSRRIGIAEILLDDWIALPREFRTTVLE